MMLLNILAFLAPEKGIDEIINDWFTPIAEAWGNIVLFRILGVPFILVLLVGGALMFTLYFTFINFRRFPLAINIVRGKYDHIEQGVDPVTTSNLNIVMVILLIPSG